MKAPPRPARAGSTLINLLVGLFLILAVFYFLLPSIVEPYENTLGNTCRNNIGQLSKALLMYANRTGAQSLPGYMNALLREDKTAYQDPTTGRPQPVSWIVLVLPDLDRAPLFNQWRAVPKGTEPTRPNMQKPESVYLEFLLCPSDPQASRTEPWLSFVANTGCIDRPAEGATETGAFTPRDHYANGMFFDRFTIHPLITGKERSPKDVGMTLAMVRDPRDKTILLTENLDATHYVFDSKTQSADGWRAVEAQTGCVWVAGTAGDLDKSPPTMTPPSPSMLINADRGKGAGNDFHHTRPSSNHPGGVNVAFVGQNVMFLNEKISYFVYAKLMSPDDANMAVPGTTTLLPEQLRSFGMREMDISP